MQSSPPPLRGRGAASNPPNRFEPLVVLPDAAARDPEDPGPRTRFFRDASRSIIAYNDSPDVGFSASVNPYRGCEHGCSYCYARPFHEYLGFSAGLDFETRILVKEDAPELLRQELASPGWEPQVIALSGVTDPYQPAERRLRITRRCLEVLAEFRNPAAIVTKNYLVTRDIDVLSELAHYHAAAVNVSVTTLDETLQRVMEPRTSVPARRLRAIEDVARAGIPVRVMVGPVIPGLTDHELPSIIQAAAQAGARGASYILLRLPHGVKELFEEWLGQHFPERKRKVLNRLRELRRGRLNDPRFHLRMRGVGVWAEQIDALFEAACRKAGIQRGLGAPLETAGFHRPGEGRQLGLFEASH
ncbi:MAG: PA0069 family radical SAM protein [Gemmatimonadetes bacterium]|nr:PA0069 family radical SAM protein [Gemmatimonadota bacterium]